MKIFKKIVVTLFIISSISYTVNFYFNYSSKNRITLIELAQYFGKKISLIISKPFKEKEYLVIDYHTPVAFQGASPIVKTHKTLPKDTQIISTEKINNVGYAFNLGKIDYSNNSVISDETKNSITRIIYESRIPKSLLKNLDIIIVNTLAVNPNTYVETNEGLIKLEDFDPNFIKGGGVYSQTIAEQSFIFINKNLIDNTTQLKEVLTHELGHRVGSQLTTAEWSEYYKLRNIPKNTPRNNSVWNLSVEEDFAEVYKNIFTGFPIKTPYGLLSGGKSWDGSESDMGPCMEKFLELTVGSHLSEKEVLNNAGLQKCRRNNASSYLSFVTSEIKNFINKVISRLK